MAHLLNPDDYQKREPQTPEEIEHINTLKALINEFVKICKPVGKMRSETCNKPEQQRLDALRPFAIKILNLDTKTRGQLITRITRAGDSLDTEGMYGGTDYDYGVRDLLVLFAEMAANEPINEPPSELELIRSKAHDAHDAIDKK
jgi:hypothetical protein